MSDNAALGHRRLRILDLTEGSDQPLVDETGDWVLAYNGEVYNFRELDSSAPSDTLALLADGPHALAPTRLRGMFAYALVSRNADELRLVRDRFGIKPLYYRSTQGRIEFGSAAGVVARMAGRTPVDQEAVRSFVRFGSVRGPRTIHQGIREVVPGSSLTSNGSVLRTESFVETPAPSSRRVPLSQVLADTVAAHTTSDVPVAVFLSGGVDSTVIATLAARQGVDVTAFTVGFPGKPFDETELAAATAKTLGLRHVVVDSSASSPDFEAYFAAMDQPSVDGLNTWIVCGAAAQAGFKVALSGIGADELFCGYSTTHRLLALQVMNTIVPSRIRPTLLARFGTNAVKANTLGNAGRGLTALHDELRSVFTADETIRLAGGPSNTPESRGRLGPPVTAIMRLELDGYLRNTLLRDADVFSMAHSLELRTPFVDEYVLQAALDIPDAVRLVMRKRLLVRAVGTERLRQLARRSKTGFTLDYEGWLRAELSDRVAELTVGPLQDILDMDAVRDHLVSWQQEGIGVMKIWSLVVLDAWMRRAQAAA